MSAVSLHSLERMDRATEARLRSRVLRILGDAFGYPTSSRFDSIVSAIESLKYAGDLLPRRIAKALEQFQGTLVAGGPEGYERDYLSVFSHVCAADCNPCETAYTAKHIFQTSQKLARLTGFYGAFGLEAGGERPDHIGVELEFLSFLYYREAVERTKERRFKARVFRRGQKEFLDRHLCRWVVPFIGLVKRKASSETVLSLASLLEQVIKSEAARHGLKLPKSQLDLQPLALDYSDSDPSPLSLATGDFAGGVFDG